MSSLTPQEVVSASIWSLMHQLGGVGLIIVGVVDASFVPIPGSVDALTIVLAASKHEWWWYYAAMATSGAVLGGYLTFRIGRKGGKESLGRKLSKRRAEKVYAAFEKWGFASVFVAALLPPPVPLVPFLLAAGAMNYSVKKFLAALIAGRALRYSLLAYLASLYGRRIFAWMGKYHTPILWTFVALSVVAGLSALGYGLYRRSKSSPRPDLASRHDAAA